MRRAGVQAPVASILVPVDGSPSSHRAVELSSQMARAFGASLTLLHVAPMDDLPVLIGETEASRGTEEGQMVLAEEVKAARRLGVDAKVELRRGRAAPQIVRAVRDLRPDLVVMGTRGLLGARSILLGSVSRTVSRQATSQVVLVR